MQPNKSKIALVIGAMYLGVSGASFAASEPFFITATTLDDVAINVTTDPSFGANIFTTVGNCTLDVDMPSETLLKMNLAADGAGSTYGEVSGTSCINGAEGVPGVVTISGSGATSVTITLDTITEADYTFTPTASYATYDNSASDDDDTISSLTSGSTLVQLAGQNDSDGATGSGHNSGVTVGDLVLVLGGVLNITSTLTPATPYTSTFNLNVVY
jgi:hypothetical protein